SRGKNCKFIGFLDGNLNYRSMHISKQQFSRVAFPEQLLFDTFSGTTIYFPINTLLINSKAKALIFSSFNNYL
ncbi:MAG: hypothetical protein Q8K95_03010, partial [Nitrosomonas sp.]|nr:hypothetical protein [Nitrosomonas sp.]